MQQGNHSGDRANLLVKGFVFQGFHVRDEVAGQFSPQPMQVLGRIDLPDLNVRQSHETPYVLFATVIQSNTAESFELNAQPQLLGICKHTIEVENDSRKKHLAWAPPRSWGRIVTGAQGRDLLSRMGPTRASARLSRLCCVP